MVDEAALAEQKAREEDARIMAELPELKMPFARARWELEVSHSRIQCSIHYETVANGSSTTTINGCWYYSIIPIERGVCSV
jgi:hypothetical protein